MTMGRLPVGFAGIAGGRPLPMEGVPLGKKVRTVWQLQF